ncbi:MAG: cation:proton antiporter [Acetobacteraceae bacterium]|nr:cation:proton antiporter [Acetobacteraceae bacterium]
MDQRLALLLLLAFMVLASKLAASLSNRVGQPAVFGELLVGLILGPTVLDVMGWPMFSGEELKVVVKDLAEIGVVLLMFLAGLETELAQMRRVGLAAFNGAAGGVALPFGVGMLASRLFGLSWRESVFVGTVLTATSVSISAQTLMELGQLRSKEGTTILGAAVIDDVMGIIVLSLVVAFSRPGQAGLGSIGGLVLGMAAFFGLATWLGWSWLERLTEAVERHVRASEAVLAFAIVVLLAYAFAAEAFGRVAAITGSYLAGLLYAQTRFREMLLERLRVIGYGFFVPIFFVSIGLDANARTLGASWVFTVVVILVAVATKLVGAAAGAWLSRFTLMESLRVGVGMVSRGEVALIVASIGLSSGVIGREVFSIMVLMTLVTTLVTPLLLRGLFPRADAGPEAPGAASVGKGGPPHRRDG